jgi:hypothetical protein
MVLTHDAVKLMKLSDLRLIEDNQPHVFGTKIINFRYAHLQGNANYINFFYYYKEKKLYKGLLF